MDAPSIFARRTDISVLVLFLFSLLLGWTEVLQLMKEGDVFEVYIPSDKAYGTSGSGAKIGPNSTLVFKIELLEVKGSSGGGSASAARRPSASTPRKPSGKKAAAPKKEEKEL
jgi:hypothetical protein